MLTFTQHNPPNPDLAVSFTLALTAIERTRSRHRFDTADGESLYLHLRRGTVLKDGDLLRSPVDDRLVRVVAKPEPVFTVTSTNPYLLLRAAYHLGNRHVPIEISASYLRLSPDPVLQKMLEQLGLEVIAEVLPFQPEQGAYVHGHAHT